MKYLIKYWVVGKQGYYYLTADNAQKAKEMFHYAKPSAQILEILESDYEY